MSTEVSNLYRSALTVYLSNRAESIRITDSEGEVVVSAATITSPTPYSVRIMASFVMSSALSVIKHEALDENGDVMATDTLDAPVEAIEATQYYAVIDMEL